MVKMLSSVIYISGSVHFVVVRKKGRAFAFTQYFILYVCIYILKGYIYIHRVYILLYTYSGTYMTTSMCFSPFLFIFKQCTKCCSEI